MQIFRSRLYHQFFTDELFKLLSLDQFLCADKQNEGAVGRAEHTVDLVDADVAVFCRFLGGQCHFQMDRNGADAILHVNHHAGAAPAQIGMKTEAAKFPVFLYNVFERGTLQSTAGGVAGSSPVAKAVCKSV